MSDQTPDDPPEWLTGPPPGYEPPPASTLTDPAVHDETHHRGAESVRRVLAECGITKTGKTWKRQTPTEGTKR